ncbi:hypothetical protein BZZ01_11405 [Nostocales cyanobacterium HT-58-2]|nr:hypothetical protein BZZ01_11405 [Nostocales cyanobacterium HT-58-2]
MNLLANSVIFLSLFFQKTIIAENSLLDRWVTLGKTNDGEVLALNESSVEIIDIQIDESINNEDGFYENLPMTKAVQFDYRIGKRERRAYTKACKNGVVVGNPHWKTYTTAIDYKFQYFLVEADSDASKKMLRRVCSLSIYKTN